MIGRLPDTASPSTLYARQCSVCRSTDLDLWLEVEHRSYLRCRHCGLISEWPIDPALERARYETDAHLSTENRSRPDLRAAVFEESLAEIERIAPPGRILDVGCGDGLFLQVAQRRGWDGHGVELSPTACAYARDVRGLRVVQGDLREADYPNSFFEVATLHDVLCHLSSPLDELVELRRVLKPGGLLVLRVRNALFHAGLFRLSRAFGPYLVFHRHCFTPRALRYLLTAAGYSRIRVRNSRPTTFDPYAVSPVGGDRGMQTIKTVTFGVAEALARLSGQTLILGPSMSVSAVNGGSVSACRQNNP